MTHVGMLKLNRHGYSSQSVRHSTPALNIQNTFSVKLENQVRANDITLAANSEADSLAKWIGSSSLLFGARGRGQIGKLERFAGYQPVGRARSNFRQHFKTHLVRNEPGNLQMTNYFEKQQSPIVLKVQYLVHSKQETGSLVSVATSSRPAPAPQP